MIGTDATLASRDGLPWRESVGPYVVRGILGGGGMGVVYRATAPDGRPVAVKTVLPHAVNRETVERFEREASIRVDHPNVIRILGAGRDPDGTPYIAMELLDGRTVASMLEERCLDATEICELASQVSRGLAAAHALGIVHRDLKPANLFWCSDGVVKILDFGIARVATGPKLTNAGAVIGTLYYLSPEQAQGRADVDARTDVWALGAVMYEAASGRAPFDRANPVAILLAIIQDEPDNLASAAPALPSDVALIIHRCLRKKPDDRWPDATSLLEALQWIEPTEAAPAAARPAPRVSVPTGPATYPSVRPGEERLVAVLLARGVRDRSLVDRAIREQGGEAIELLASDIVGLFGGFRSEGDEAARAVVAAVRTRHAASRMAVGSGRAVAKGAGVSGQAVERAETGCALGCDGVAVDADTVLAVKARFVLVPAADPRFQEVVAERRESVSPTAATARKPTVDREVEGQRLSSALDAVFRERRPHGALLVGPAGIGKSQLRRELEAVIQARGEPVCMLLGEADPLQSSSSLSLFASALRRRARSGAQEKGWPRIDPPAPPIEQRHAVTMLTREAVRDANAATECAAFLGELIGISMPDTGVLGAARTDPQWMADRLRLAVHDYLAAMSAHTPVALLVENLHWADPLSIGLLGELPALLADRPLFLLATARPHFLTDHPDKLDHRAFEPIPIGGLKPIHVAALAERVAGAPVHPDLSAALSARTDGNPLFVEQIVLSLREEGRLSDAALTLAELPLPVSVEAALQSRLDHLPDAERELCKCASVFGRPVQTHELVGAGVPSPEQRLHTLIERDFFSVRIAGRKSGTQEYQFRSPLIADVAYRTIAGGPRAQLHGRVADYLASVPGADAEEIALHYEKAKRGEEAVLHHVRAAIEAAARGDGDTTLRCSDAVITRGVPKEIAFALHMARADALRFAGRRAEQGDALVEALAGARDDLDRARALMERAVWLCRTGRTEEATRLAAEALETARRTGDVEATTLALGRQAEVLTFASRYAEAQVVLGQAVALAYSAAPQVRGQLSASQARLAGFQGNLGEARVGFTRAAELFQLAGDVRRAAANQANLADAFNRVGAYTEAEAALRAAREACRRVGNRPVEGYALANLGYALVMLGRPEEALDAVGEALQIADGTKDARMRMVARTYEARARAALGELDRAAEIARATATAARDAGYASLEATASAVAARARLQQGEVEEAVVLSTHALRMRDELGGVEEDEAALFLVHIDALGAAGRAADAGEVRNRARSRLGEVARRIEDAAWRKRFLRDVPANRALMRDE